MRRQLGRVSRLAAVGPAVVVILVVTSCSAGGQLVGPVAATSGNIGNCFSASTDRPWSELQAHPTELPMDALEIAGNHPITMISVTAISPHGVKIDEVKFVAGDGVGAGFRYGDLKAAGYPAAWTAGPVMPNAQLQPLRANSNIAGGSWSRFTYWQTIIGVTPTDGEGGTIAGLIYKYRVGGHTYTLRGQAFSALTRQDYKCEGP